MTQELFRTVRCGLCNEVYEESEMRDLPKIICDEPILITQACESCFNAELNAELEAVVAAQLPDESDAAWVARCNALEKEYGFDKDWWFCVECGQPVAVGGYEVGNLIVNKCIECKTVIKRRCVFLMEAVPFEESDANLCVRAFQYDIYDPEAPLNKPPKEDMEFIGNFWDRRSAVRCIGAIAADYDEFRVFEPMKRRKKGKQGIQPRADVTRTSTVKPLDEMEIYNIPLDKISVTEWSPDKEGELPAEEVHLVVTLDEDLKLCFRFTSPDTLGFVIEELIAYRKLVWADAKPVDPTVELVEVNDENDL